MTALVIRADARALPLAADSVDLVVTSPPYFALRSYQDGGEHYAGQVGAEPTPAEYVAALLEVMAECVRVLKPSGSIFVNLGDKYVADNRGSGVDRKRGAAKHAPVGPAGFVGRDAARQKSLMGIPWRFALACIDELGLILRAEIVWSKPNGLPESVTDRVRRSHEQWFHFTVQPRYYSAVDEIREPLARIDAPRPLGTRNKTPRHTAAADYSGWKDHSVSANPLGKLPGSVWTVPTEPLQVPAHLGVDHFAAFPLEFPLRIIKGWSPTGVCVECGDGRRAVVQKGAPLVVEQNNPKRLQTGQPGNGSVGFRYAPSGQVWNAHKAAHPDTIVGYACACAEPTAATTPGVVLDPFGGTGTTALAAHAIGRTGISVDLSSDYCRLARWRTTDRGELARALRVPKPEPVADEQGELFGAAS